MNKFGADEEIHDARIGGGLTDLDVGGTSTKVANITLNGNPYKISDKVFELVTLTTSNFTYRAYSNGTGTPVKLEVTLTSTSNNIYCIESASYRVDYTDSYSGSSYSQTAQGATNTSLTRTRTHTWEIVGGNSGHSYINISIRSMTISGYMFNVL